MRRNQIVSCLWSAIVLLAVSGHAAVNNPPTANPDDYTVNEDRTLTVSVPGVLANDTDPESSSLTALLVIAPTNGNLTLASNGSFTYRPNTNFFGFDSFTYRARDGQSNSVPTTVTITVNATNDAPRATNNAYTANSDTTLVIVAPGVLGNDFDVDGNPLTSLLVSNVTRGALVLNGDGSFSYTPNAGYHGSDSFVYRAHDGTTNSANATVTLNVLPAPIVVITPPASQTNCVGDTATFSVSATGTALKYQWQKGTTNLVGQTNATLLLPNVQTTNVGAYRVRITGATNSITNSATLTVNIPINTPPLPDRLRIAGSIVIFNATATGTGPITYSWRHDGVEIPNQTNATLVLSNLLTTDSGIYTVIVSGACGSVTNSATLTVAPCFNSLDVMMVLDRSGSMVGQAYADARTAASNFVQNLHLSAETNDTLGLVSYNPTSALNQRLTNSPAAVEQAIQSLGPATNGTCISCGIITAQAELVSARHRSNALPVMVLLTDGIPHDFDTPSNALYNAQQAKNAGTRIFTVAFGTNIDSALMIGMASQPGDYFYATNSAQLAALFDAIATVLCRPPTNIFGPNDLTVCAGANVNLSVSASGCAQFNYQWHRNGSPLAGETNRTLSFGAVSVTNSGIYSVVVTSNCRNVTNSATLTVNAPVNIVIPPISQANHLGNSVVFSAGVTGTSLSYQWIFDGAVVGTESTLTLNNITTNQAGTYCFVARSADCGGPVTNCVTLTILNRPPVANDNAYALEEDTTLTLPAPGVMANDSDPDGDVMAATLEAGVSYGVLTFNGDGSFTYIPNADFNGIDAFTYRVNDGVLTSGVAVVIITVAPANDRPIAVDDAYTTWEDTMLQMGAPGILGNDIDLDSPALISVLLSNVTHGTLDLTANGSFVYIPNTNFHGEDSFTYRAFDGWLFSTTALVRITVLSSNDVPVANDDAYTIAEDTSITLLIPGVLTNDTDADGDPLASVLVTTVTNGTLLLSLNGSLLYRPNTNYHGIDTFTYRATDGAGTSELATVTITITPVNDPPIAGVEGDNYSVREDQVLSVVAPGVLGNDSDADGDALTAALISGVSHGTLTLNANGAFTYAPAADYFGSDSFAYAASDGQANSTQATVNITVTPVNDAPDFTAGANVRVNFNVGPQSIANFASGISAGPGNESTQALHFELANDNASLFSAQPAVSSDGTLSYTPAGSIFGVATVTAVLKDNGGTANGGADTSAARLFTITLNGPPIVSIINPTNNATFVGTNTITVVANASDPDSVVTNVTIFSGTNVIGSSTNAPYFASLINAPFGIYAFRAIAVDDLGLSATSSVVTVTVTQSPPVTALGPIVLNRQNALFEQFARISNPTPRSFPNGVRLFIGNLDATNRVFNATGTNAGIPYIDIVQPLPSMGFLDVLVQYYVPNPRTVPNPILSAEPLPFTVPVAPAPVLVVGRANGSVVLRFNTTAGRLYYLQSSADFTSWQTLPGLIQGSGGPVQRTNAVDGSQQFFRALLLP